MKISRNTVISFIIFSVVLSVYIATLCPTVYLGQSANYVSIATGSSILKGIGEPIWHFLAHRTHRIIFRLFSPAEPAWSLNLLSAVFGAWTVALVYIILANIGHNKTTEEMGRFHQIPNLRQISAAAGALLLAFCPLFWEASVLAGPGTLKLFLFVITALYLIKYVFTRKKRYILLFGLFYGIALANSPVMLLFLPIIMLILFISCREIFDDVIVSLLMLILFAGGFAFFAGISILKYARQDAVYAQSALTVSHGAFFYMLWFVQELREALPISFSPWYYPFTWLFTLVIPGFVPIIYLAWKKRIPAGSAPGYLSPIKFLVMLAFTGVGIAYLLGYNFYTVAYGRRYLGPTTLIAAWTAYMLGYWMVIISGRKTESTLHEEQPEPGYSKPAFAFITLIVIGIVAFSFVWNVGDNNMRNMTIARDYGEDVLASCEPGTVIVVPHISEMGFFSGIGPALQYVAAYPKSGSTITGSAGNQTRVIDVPTALVLTQLNRIDLERYIAHTIWGEKDSSLVPRSTFSDPRQSPYDRILQETAAERESKLALLHNHTLMDIRNPVMARRAALVPRGVVYRVEFSTSPSFIAREYIRNNRTFWQNPNINRFITANKKKASEIRVDAKFTPHGIILNTYSRLANDSGILCDEQVKTQREYADEAIGYYQKALEFNPDNYSANVNLSISLKNKRESQTKIDSLEGKAKSIWVDFSKMVEQEVAQTEPTERLLSGQRESGQEYKDLRTFRYLVIIYGHIKNPDYYIKLASGDIERIPPDQREPYIIFRNQMLNLALLVDPDNPDLHFQRAAFLASTQIFMSKLQAIHEFKVALENGFSRRRTVLQNIGYIYAEVGNVEESERYLKQALDTPSDAPTETEKFRDDLRLKFTLVDLFRRSNYKLDEALAIAEELSKVQEDPDNSIFLTAVSYILDIMMIQERKDEEVEARLNEFIAMKPDLADRMKGSLAQLYNSRGRVDKAGRIFEEIYHNYTDRDGSVAVILSALYLSERNWDKAIALRMNAENPRDDNLAVFHFNKSQAYQRKLDFPKAIEELEIALKHSGESEDSRRKVVTEINVRNNLSWMYYLAGWSNRDTPEGRENLDRALELSRMVYETTQRIQINDPQTLSLWDTFAWILYRLSDDPTDKEEAYNIMERVYTGNPTNAQIIYHFGVMLYDRERKEMGLDMISRAYARGLGELEDQEAMELLKANNRPIPEKEETP